MFGGIKRWRASRRKLAIFNRMKHEAEVAIAAGEGFAAPLEMIGTNDDVQYFVEALTTSSGDHVRATVHAGMCFVYPDGAESAPTQFTMIGVKR